MGRSTTDILTEKSISAFISAIEVYNKPDFKYREENFVILLINAWELILKAKIISDNNGDKTKIYVKEYLIKKDGKKSKNWRYKKTNSSNYHTIQISKCIKILQISNVLDAQVEENIFTLLEIRNSSIHYYNVSVDFIKVVHEIGSASIYAFMEYLHRWFGKRLDQFNLYLLPISFFKSESISSIPTYKNESELLDYINKQQKKYPYNEDDAFHYATYIKISFTKKSNGTAGVFLTNDPSAPMVQLTDLELKERYPLTYNDLLEKCKFRYSDFKLNQGFHKYRRNLFDDPKYCYSRYLNLNKKGQPRIFYSSAILFEFDKYYTKNKSN